MRHVCVGDPVNKREMDMGIDRAARTLLSNSVLVTFFQPTSSTISYSGVDKMKILILLKLKTSTWRFLPSDGGHGLEATVQQRLLAIDLRIATPKTRSETIIISL